jgi:hypothetical protein
MCRYHRNHPASSTELRRQECGFILQVCNVVHTDAGCGSIQRWLASFGHCSTGCRRGRTPLLALLAHLAAPSSPTPARCRRSASGTANLPSLHEDAGRGRSVTCPLIIVDARDPVADAAQKSRKTGRTAGAAHQQIGCRIVVAVHDRLIHLAHGHRLSGDVGLRNR